MSSRGAWVLAAMAAAATTALVVSAAVNRRDLAFGPGVPITRVAVALAPGQTACQREIRVLEGFRAVEVVPRWLGRPGPPLRLEVLDRATGARLRGAGVSAGYPDNRPLAVAVGPVAAGRAIDVCIANRGHGRVGLEGGKAESVPASSLDVGGVARERNAIALRFLREPRSVLSQVPTIFRRAALFRPDWVGPWTFWLLAAGVVLAVPLLLARALSAAERETPPPA